MKQILFFVILFLISGLIFAQEVTTFAAANSSANSSPIDKTIDTLSIPFFSDFSETNPFKYYQNNDVSIATFEAISPPSIYAAMFDATNNEGNFYATNYNQSIVADFLTSKPINLFFPTDTTIYFSFFYEPKGRLDAPETTDSLVLQFYAPNQQKWETVWIADNYTTVEFQLVKFKISDTAFLQKGFQFRFYNRISMPPNSHPSLVSNCDYWFVDYIYLNKGRSFNDNSKRDIAFQYPTIFKIDEYLNVPYSHYKDVFGSVNHNIRLRIRNNDDNIREIDSMYIVFTDKNNALPNDTLYLGSYPITSNNTLSLFNENISFNFPIQTNDMLNYEMKTVLITDTYDSISNNNIIQTKKFGTTYAYDDGTAENGYGLYGDGTIFSYVAQQYVTYKQDEITGIKAYFNKTFKSEQPFYFYAVVWDNLHGKPYNKIYEQGGFEIDHDNLNNFQLFEFEDPITVSDTFYIGWMKTTEALMNIGLDMNFTQQNKKFYSINNGIWSESLVDGVIMMQPIFGDVNLADITVVVDDADLAVNLYPNPVSDILNIQINQPNSDYEQVFIYDLSGREIYSETFDGITTIDLSSIAAGFYLIKINSGKKTFSDKIIIK